ncbi:MAG: cytochrome c maturation protein CcmE [Rubellimicrobium sp.]|nr:cytochrome c maturation protein CcmE [Rubellimicrobium sp.]
MAGLKKKRRIQVVIAAFVALFTSTAIIIYAMGDGINYFYMPEQVLMDPPPETQTFRLGGNVEEGSIRQGEGVHFTFRITDGVNALPVSYVGNDPRPDLFGDGQGTIATGRLVGGVFEATEILAKHDEDYVPREVIEGLKDAGVYVAPEDE